MLLQRARNAQPALTQDVARQTATSVVLAKLTSTRTLPHRVLLVKPGDFGNLEQLDRLLRA